MEDIGIVGIQFKRNTGVFLHQIHADQVPDLLGDGHTCKLDYLQSQLHLKSTGNHFLSDKSIFYQNLTDLFAASLLKLQGFF